MEVDKDLKPWDRQPKESTTAYQAFCVYRDGPYKNPPIKRSMRGVAEALGRNRSTIGTYMVKNKWVERCQEYDNEIQHIELEERKAAIKEMQKLHIDVAKSLQKKALKALAELPEEQMSARNILDDIIQGIELERRARIEQIEGTPSNARSGGKPGLVAELDEPEQSTMMQLVKSLEAARAAKRKKEEGQ